MPPKLRGKWALGITPRNLTWFIKDKLAIHPVKWFDEVLDLALERSPMVSLPRDADGAPATTDPAGRHEARPAH